MTVKLQWIIWIKMHRNEWCYLESEQGDSSILPICSTGNVIHQNFYSLTDIWLYTNILSNIYLIHKLFIFLLLSLQGGDQRKMYAFRSRDLYLLIDADSLFNFYIHAQICKERTLGLQALVESISGGKFAGNLCVWLPFACELVFSQWQIVVQTRMGPSSL